MKVRDAIHAIMRVLEVQGAPAHFHKAVRTLSTLDVYVRPGNTRVAKILALHKDLSAAVARMVRLTEREGCVIVQIPLEKRTYPSLSDLLSKVEAQGGSHPWTMYIGYSMDGRIESVNLRDPSQAHVGVFGMTGSGKSMTMQSMLASLVRQHSPEELSLVIIDPKWNPDSLFAKVLEKHLAAPPAAYAEDATKYLEQVVKEMVSRRDGRTYTRILTVVDEVGDLCAESSEARDALTRIIQRGRGVGVHAMVGTTKGTARALSGIITANLSVRVVGRVANAQDSVLATGFAGAGAQYLLGKGDLLVIKDTQPVRVQGALPDLENLESVILDQPMRQTAEETAPKLIETGPLSQWLTARTQRTGTLRAGVGFEDYAKFSGDANIGLVKWGQAMVRQFEKDKDTNGVFYKGVSLK